MNQKQALSPKELLVTVFKKWNEVFKFKLQKVLKNVIGVQIQGFKLVEI